MRHAMPWAERLLLALSRKPDEGDYATPHDRRTLDNALSLLSAVFPQFLDTIRERDILDFGCGSGLQAIAMGRSGARYVFGLDANQRSVAEARELAAKLRLQSRVNAEREAMRGTADPTYLVYTLGKHQILKLREDYRKKVGDRFNLQEFHERFLGFGYPPVKLIREEMLGDDSPTL